MTGPAAIAPIALRPGPALHRDAVPLWVIFGLAMAPVAALGLARFAYALLLPAMRADLGWSFADAGAMNTANAAGYLAGALAVAPMGRRFGDKGVFAFGLLATSLAIGAQGLTGNFMGLLAIRALAGVSGALCFISGAGLTAAAAVGGSRSRAPTLFSIYFAGAGAGVAASALVVPPLLAGMGWRAGWFVLGAVSLAATLFAGFALARAPRTTYADERGEGGWSARFMACEMVAYGLFGAGYIAYATFIIAYLRSDLAFSSGMVTAFWATLGLSTVAAAFVWGPILARLRGGWGAVTTIGLVTAGAGLPVILPNTLAAFVSAVLFGGSFLAVVAAVTSFARRAARPHAWTTAIAALTVVFGLGQCVGPLLSGMLSDGPAGVRAGLWLSAAILLAGTLVAAFQPEPELNEE